MHSAREVVKAFIPPRHRDVVRFAGYRAAHFGTSRYCPCCGSHVRRFHPFGEVPRPEARCPVCGALERHRLAAMFFRRHPQLLESAARILHVAPEPQMARLLRRTGRAEYISIDLEEGYAMRKMDIRALDFPDGVFDAAFCSHVLEHVREDDRAMAELCRVLRPGGWVIVQVPVKGATTFEDFSVQDPEERRRLFGQPDHVRVYGWDVADRLADAGFAVTVDGFVRGLGEEVIRRFGLNAQESIFFCRRPV